MNRFVRRRLWIDISIFTILLAGIGYGAYRYRQLSHESALQQQTITTLRTSIAELEDNLSLTQYERDRLTTVLGETEQKAGALEAQTTELEGTVDTLQKLTTLDPELLKKYSKVYFLNEHYVPSSLTPIDAKYVSGKDRVLEIHGEVWPHLIALLDATSEEGLGLRITSSYRSFGTQATLKASYRVTYGTTAANRFSAEQGYSEHQLGTTVDFTTTKTGDLSGAFDKTPEFTWLTEHAHEYGFVLSYPKNNKYYIYEPWHWRYVGIELATKLHDDRTYLYDIDQREIDKYLLSIFD